MKKFILILFLFCASIAIRIEVGSSVQLIEKIQLTCSGNKGKIAYQAQTLPPGVRLTGSKLEIFDKTLINGGVFPVRIRAMDQSGAEDQKIIVLTLRNQGQQRQQIINKQNIGNSKNSPSISVSISQIYPNNSPNNGPMPVPGSPKSSNVITPSSPTYSGISSPIYQQKGKNIIQKETNNLLNQLSVPQKIPNESSDVNNLKSRVEQMPTNADPNLLNYAPLIIGTNQASTANVHRRPINSNNVKFRDAFMRQSNAGLSIGNLLTIVQQAKSNRNAAIEQVAKRQQLLIQARKKVSQSSIDSSKVQNDYNRVSLGIRAVTQSINDFKKKQQQIENLSKQKPFQIQALSEGIAASKTKLDNINFVISQKQKIYNQVKHEKQLKDQECNNLQNQVQNTYKEKQKKIAQVSTISVKIMQAKRKMESDRANVNDLKQKLARAQAQFKQSQRTASDLQNQQKQLKIYFLKYDARLNDTKARSAACPTQSKGIDQKLKSMETQQFGKIKEQKKKIQKELGSLNDQLQKINTDISTLPKQIQFYKLQVKQLEPKLITLKQQFEISQRNVISAKGNGVDADGQVRNAQANLQAALTRFKNQQNILQQGNKNLALARAEKTRADELVEQMIRQGADVEVYATTNPQSTHGISNSQSNSPQNTIFNDNNNINFNKNQNLSPINNNNMRKIPNQNQQNINIPDPNKFINQISNNIAINTNGPYTQNYLIDNINNNVNPASYIKNNVINDFDNRPINTNPNININDNYFSMDNQIKNMKDNFNKNIEQSNNIIPTLPSVPSISSTYIPSQTSKFTLPTRPQDQIPLIKQIKFDQNLDFMRPNLNGTYQINSVSEFVQRQFDPSIKTPTDIKSTTLYPVTFPPTPDIDLNSIQGNTSLKSFEGYVIGVGQSFLSLLSNDTNIYEVSYLPKMKAFSTEQNSKIEIGRKIIVRGYLQKPLNILTLLLLSISE